MKREWCQICGAAAELIVTPALLVFSSSPPDTQEKGKRNKRSMSREKTSISTYHTDRPTFFSGEEGGDRMFIGGGDLKMRNKTKAETKQTEKEESI